MADETGNKLVMVAVETSLGARFLTSAAATVTFAELRGLLEIEHFAYFPNHGKIIMDTMLVEYDCKMYHVRDTLSIGQVSWNNWVKVHAKAYSEAPKDVENVNHSRSLQCKHPTDLMGGTSWVNRGATLVGGCGPLEGAAHDFSCTKRQGSAKKACWHCQHSSLRDKLVLQETSERSCHCDVLLAKRSSNVQGDLPCMLLSSEAPCTQAWHGAYVEAPTTLNRVFIQPREKRHKKKKKQPQRGFTSTKTLLNTSENADLETQHTIQLVCEVAGETGKEGKITCDKLETSNNSLQCCDTAQEIDCYRPQPLIENDHFTEENGQRTGFSGPNFGLQHQASLLSKHDMIRSPRSGFEQEIREETVTECNLGDGKVNSIAKKDKETPQASCKPLLEALPEPSASNSSSTKQQANDDTRKDTDAMTNDTSNHSKHLQSLSELCVSNNGLHNPQPASLVADIVFETQESQMATQLMILNEVNMETGILRKEVEGALGHRIKKKRKKMKCVKAKSSLDTGANLEAENLVKETVSTNVQTMDKIDRGIMAPELDRSVRPLEEFQELPCSSVGAKSKVEVSDKDRWVENFSNQTMSMDKIHRDNMTPEGDRPGGHLEECQESPCSSLHAKSKVNHYQISDKDGLIETKDSKGSFNEQERSSEVGLEREFNEVSKSSFDEQERLVEAVLKRELKEVFKKSFHEQERSSEAVLERKSYLDQAGAEFGQGLQNTKDLNLSRTDESTNTGCSRQDMQKEDSLVDRLDSQNEADNAFTKQSPNLKASQGLSDKKMVEYNEKKGRKKRKKRRIEQEIAHPQMETVGRLFGDKAAQIDHSSSQCSQKDSDLGKKAEDGNELELAIITDAIEDDREQDHIDVDYSEPGKCRKKKRKRKGFTKAEPVRIENTYLKKSTGNMLQSDIADSPSASEKNRKALKKSLNVFEFDDSGNDEPEKTSSSRQGKSQETQNLDKLCTAAIEVFQDEDHDLAKAAFRKTGRKCVNPKRWITVLSERLMQSQCPKNGKTKKKSARTLKTAKKGGCMEKGDGILGGCMGEGDDSSFQKASGNDSVQQEEEKQESTANNDGKIACPAGCGRLYAKRTSAYYRHKDRCLKKRNHPQ